MELNRELGAHTYALISHTGGLGHPANTGPQRLEVLVVVNSAAVSNLRAPSGDLREGSLRRQGQTSTPSPPPGQPSWGAGPGSASGRRMTQDSHLDNSSPVAPNRQSRARRRGQCSPTHRPGQRLTKSRNCREGDPRIGNCAESRLEVLGVAHVLRLCPLLASLVEARVRGDSGARAIPALHPHWPARLDLRPPFDPA